MCFKYVCINYSYCILYVKPNNYWRTRNNLLYSIDTAEKLFRELTNFKNYNGHNVTSMFFNTADTTKFQMDIDPCTDCINWVENDQIFCSRLQRCRNIKTYVGRQKTVFVRTRPPKFSKYHVNKRTDVQTTRPPTIFSYVGQLSYTNMVFCAAAHIRVH